MTAVATRKPRRRIDLGKPVQLRLVAPDEMTLKAAMEAAEWAHGRALTWGSEPALGRRGQWLVYGVLIVRNKED